MVDCSVGWKVGWMVGRLVLGRLDWAGLMDRLPDYWLAGRLVGNGKHINKVDSQLVILSSHASNDCEANCVRVLRNTAWSLLCGVC